jgi:AcrR family transcriptional regulator
VVDESAALGLRERKKRRTRTTLIDAAADLCVRQGYDNTTVEQIAAAAEVSARTFNRYFSSKEAVIAAFADEIDEDMAAVLAEQPTDIPELEALLRTQLVIFAPDAPNGPGAFNRMAVLISIVNASQTFNTAAFAFTPEPAEKATVVVLARRMGLPLEHPAVRLVADAWTLLFATSFRGMGLPGGDPIEPSVLCRRLRETYAMFARLWAPWDTGDSAPQAVRDNSDYLR